MQQMPGVCPGGGMLAAGIDSHIIAIQNSQLYKEEKEKITYHIDVIKDRRICSLICQNLEECLRNSRVRYSKKRLL